MGGAVANKSANGAGGNAFSRVASAGFFCLAVGCAPSPELDPPVLAVEQVQVDTDVIFDVVAGEGLGVFVEYQSGGFWELFTTCDTASSGLLCDFDIIVSVDAPEELVEVRGLELEGDDELWELDAGALQLLTFTGEDFDRLVFETKPGATVRVDARLDGAVDPFLVRWIELGGADLRRATTPLDLRPAVP